MADTDTWFVVTYRDPRDEDICSVRAREVRDSELGIGFIAISDFVFDSGSVIVDPRDDALRSRLENVRRLHLNLYRILSIEEVGATNSGLHFQADRSNLVVLRRPDGGPKDSD